jgi:hypothetical protein
MRRYTACLIALLVLLLAAVPARAQTGTGLYKPFPNGDSRERVVKYYFDRLGPEGRRAVDPLSAKQIAAGAFVRGARPATTQAASVRGGETSRGGPAWPLQLLLLTVPVGAVLVARRS